MEYNVLNDFGDIYTKEKKFCDFSKLDYNLSKIRSKGNNLSELIVLIESGSLAPPHKMHIELMEKSKKVIESKYNKTVLGGFIIPSGDVYVSKKLGKDFIPLNHRVEMTKLLIKNNNWLTVLDWGDSEVHYVQYKLNEAIKEKYQNLNIKCLIVFGVDVYLREGFHSGWPYVCVCRPGYDLTKLKLMGDISNFIIVENETNEISSTITRKAIREKDYNTVKELVGKEVTNYIKENEIFYYH